MKYDYLVAYNFKNKEGSGFGNIELTLNNKIKNFNDAEEIRKFIQDKNNFESVVIINYKLIKRHWRGRK